MGDVRTDGAADLVCCPTIGHGCGDDLVDGGADPAIIHELRVDADGGGEIPDLAPIDAIGFLVRAVAGRARHAAVRNL
jgi:hypothetical protein